MESGLVGGMCHCCWDVVLIQLGRNSHADPLWGTQEDILGCFDSVFHQHRHSHRANASWHWGDESRLLSHTWKCTGKVWRLRPYTPNGTFQKSGPPSIIVCINIIWKQHKGHFINNMGNEATWCQACAPETWSRSASKKQSISLCQMFVYQTFIYSLSSMKEVMSLVRFASRITQRVVHVSAWM